MPINDKYWIIVLMCSIVLLLIAIGLNTQNPIEPSNPIGLAINPLYPAFSTPISTFSTPSTITFTTTDTTKPLTFTVSDDAVYKTGYISIDGNSWQQVAIKGTVLGGNWFKGSSTGTVNILKSQIGTGTNTNNYIIIYTCTRSGTSWDCHDNKWQIKDFTTIKQEAACTPTTCTALGYNCGNWSNGCTGTLNCGTCTTEQACTAGRCLTTSPPPTGTGKTYYLAPTGSDTSGDGSINKPWFTLNKAWTVIQPGDTVYLRGGTYRYSHSQELTGINGEADNLIRIWAYSGETPIITKASSGWTYYNMAGIYFEGDYFHWKGITLSGFTQIDCTIWDSMIVQNSNHNILEQMEFKNGMIGLDINEHSTDNLVLNCDFHHNYDPCSDVSYDSPYGNADGANAHTSIGTTNTFRGCRFWSNSDDGLDLFNGDGLIIVDNCWSWKNGYREDGTTKGGDGYGFKGGITATDQGSVHLRTFTNCLAFHNREGGFGQNAARCIFWMYNNVAYHNNDGDGYFLGFMFDSYEGPSYAHIIRNNICYQNQNTYGLEAVWSIITTQDHNSWEPDGTNVRVSDADFVSVVPTGVDGPRKADGSLPDITFLHLAPGSDLINAGINVNLPYNGAAPDLGAFETQ